MLKLIFSEKDKRSNGEPFNKERPWLRQNAELDLVFLQQQRMSHYHCPVVHFLEAPTNITDLVSSIYIKRVKKSKK